MNTEFSPGEVVKILPGYVKVNQCEGARLARILSKEFGLCGYGYRCSIRPVFDSPVEITLILPEDAFERVSGIERVCIQILSR